MSRLQRFIAKPMEFDIEGEKMTISPLKGKALEYIIQLENDDKKAAALGKLIEETLLSSWEGMFPGEELPKDPSQRKQRIKQLIEELSAGFKLKLMEPILKVNGLLDEVDVKKAKEALAKDSQDNQNQTESKA